MHRFRRSTVCGRADKQSACVADPLVAGLFVGAVLYLAPLLCERLSAKHLKFVPVKAVLPQYWVASQCSIVGCRPVAGARRLNAQQHCFGRQPVGQPSLQELAGEQWAPKLARWRLANRLVWRPSFVLWGLLAAGLHLAKSALRPLARSVAPLAVVTAGSRQRQNQSTHQ
jgi:hypothetical protein